MFNPKYRVLITKTCFPEDLVVGLGTQLISIVNSIKKYLLPHNWYGADVDAIGKNARKYRINNIALGEIGNDLMFIDYCSGIKQFIWGVFLCVNDNVSIPNIQTIEIETEDEAYRSINLEGILLEIRAFDTTFFEIFTEDLELINKISEIYKVPIEKIDN